MPRQTQTLVTGSELRQDLRALGVAAGDLVMVHAGLRSVGPVLGGVNAVAEALLSVIAPAGSLVAYVDWETGAEPEQFADPRLREEIPTFDPRTARAMRDHGILAETIRTWPGAIRSRHPDGGFSAIGERAEWLCADQPLHYPYGPDSPLAKMTQAGGKVLLLGAPLGTLTILHHAEHLAHIPGKRVIRYQRPMLVDAKRRWVDFEEFDTSEPVTDALKAMTPDPFTQIATAFLGAGSGRTGRVGNAVSHLFDAALLVAHAVRWLEERCRTR